MPASVSRIPFGPSRVTALVLGDLSVPADETPWVITCTGVPTVDLPDGALALRRDGSAGSTIYERAGGAWSALGGASATAVTAASTFAADNGLIRADGTGRGVQGSSAWTLSDAGLLSGALLTVTGTLTLTGATITGLGVASVSGAAVSATLASTLTGEGAALIGVEDAGGYYSGTTVEAALQTAGAGVQYRAFTAFKSSPETHAGATTLVETITTADTIPAGTYQITGYISYTSSSAIDGYVTLGSSGTVTAFTFSTSYQTDGIVPVTTLGVVGAAPTAGTNCSELVGNAAARAAHIGGVITLSVAGTVSMLVAGKTPGDITVNAGTHLVLQALRASS